ncbi:hypothetical protein NP493_202g03045 [Ridgeia piscesae]|uniref:LRRCT domain-containing protein n=1 Tax=Ridgeia piscesae TaxID=27915 RepID=A0AAD9P1C8_RIDPI|nr:hypothetical protein NP493_202g03045 [Ridgeia piscesae]
MAGVMAGLYRDFGAALQWRLARLPYLLTVVAVTAMFALPATHGKCPAVNQHCSCRKDLRISSTFNNIFCEDMGKISQVPPFYPSETTYFLLTIRGDTTLLTLQVDAFKGINIRGLELSSLGITTIIPGAFAGIGNMTRLRALYLDNNQLVALLNDTFSGLGALTGLYLRNNRLTTLSPAMFSKLKRLQHLYLGGNRLVTIPDDTFTALSNLWLLNLDGIHMATLNTTLFRNLSNLERLHLENNQIERIPDQSFDGLTQLKELHLSNNRLSSVSPVVINHLPLLERLYLSGNPLVCDCDLAWLRWITTITFNDKPVCSNPSRVRGSLVTSFDISMCSPLNDTTTASETTDNPSDVATTVIEEAYVTTVGEVSTTEAHSVTTRSGALNNSSKGSQELLMIVIGSLSAALLLAFGLLVYRNRMACAKCRETEGQVDPYTHNLPESRDTTCTVYDTIAAPVPTYENISRDEA